MLQLKHLLVTYRKDQAYPHKLESTPDNLEIASNLLTIFEEHQGEQRQKIEEVIRYTNYSSLQPKSIQSFVKILFDSSSWIAPDSEETTERRTNLFLQSAAYWQSHANEDLSATEHQENILINSEIEQDLIQSDINTWLYADMLSFQILEKVAPFTPKELLNQYNIQQAQTLLFYTSKLELTLYETQQGLPQVMQMIKFFGLFFSVQKNKDKSMTVSIEGASSILEESRSYGIELAKFFPAILLLQGKWQLTAFLAIDKKKKPMYFKLTQDNIYQSTYPEKNTWSYLKIQELVQTIQDDHKAAKCKATTTIITLKNNKYLLPDFTIGTGKNKIYFQWIRYFNPSKTKYLFDLQDQVPKNYIFIIKAKKKDCIELQKLFQLQLFIFVKDLQSNIIYQHWEKYIEANKKQ